MMRIMKFKWIWLRKKLKSYKKAHVANLESKKRHAANVEAQEVDMPSKKMKSNDEEDRLTSLHDSLVAHILSYLSTRDAIRTSTLCREWKYKWRNLLINFEIYWDHYWYLSGNSSELQLLISTALKHNLEGFILWSNTLRRKCDIHIVLPSSLINGTFLRTLHLNGLSSLTLNVATHNVGPRLTWLVLDNLEIVLNGGNSSSSIATFKFDVLEKLRLNATKWVNVKSVEIYAPQLTTFTSETFADEQPDFSTVIVIDAPKLTVFKSTGSIPYNIRILNGSSVTYALFDQEWNVKYEDPQLAAEIGLQVVNLLTEFTNLEILEIWDPIAHVIAQVKPPRYLHDKLNELDIYRWNNIGNIPDLFQLLDAAPALQFLQIELHNWKHYDYEKVEHVPSCLVSHLEGVEFRALTGRRTEYNLIKIFMTTAEKLLELHVVTCMERTEDNLNRVRKKLSTYPRSSPWLTITVS